MPLPSNQHRTPLRRVSQGSLFALSRSGAYPDAPEGLGFLEPAMSELSDEAEALQANIEHISQLSHSLATFNESFATWLYLLDMNSLTTDWPHAPTDVSFQLARRRAEEDALAVMEAAEESKRQAVAAANAEKTSATDVDPESSYLTAMGNTTTTNTSKSASSVKKKVGGGKKPKLTAKEKKERSIELEKIISTLPLEFRGSDPTLRRNMEMTIEGLWDSANQASTLQNLIAPPDLNQARVNKCLIALVNRKLVRKDNSTGSVIYHWLGLP